MAAELRISPVSSHFKCSTRSTRCCSLPSAGGRLAIALVELVDDHGHFSPRTHLVVHFAAVAWALYWLCGMPPLPVGGGYVLAGPAWTAIGAVGLVWLVNLYNFMDGIAGVEAASVALGASLLGGAPGWLTVAAAAAGFLVLSWPARRIFMGDVGSGFLGFVLGVLVVDAAAWERVPLASSAILLGVFLVDATMPSLRRWLRGERLSQAHCGHAYQRRQRGASGNIGPWRSPCWRSTSFGCCPGPGWRRRGPRWGLVAALAALVPLAWCGSRGGWARAPL